MRAFIVLLALVATPFVASVAQDPLGSNPGVRHAYGLVNDPPGLGHDALHCAMRADLHPGTEIINKCDPPAPPPGSDAGPVALSSSIARLLLNRSPLPAWHNYPHLNTTQEYSDRCQEWGSIVHRLFLGRAPEIVEIDVDD